MRRNNEEIEVEDGPEEGDIMAFERYSRQIDIPEIGKEGQEKLGRRSVLVIGAGGLGSTLLYCLAGAGVGRIGFIDGDIVSMSNLNRQFLHFERDIGEQKVLSAQEKLHAFNPTLIYEPIYDMIDRDNAEKYISGYDITVLAVDNIELRFIVNEVCCRLTKPLVNGGVDGMSGMLNLILPGRTACLRCLYDEEALPNDRPSSFAPVVATISALAAQLTILVLLDIALPPFDKTLFFSGIDVSWHSVKADRQPGCPACGSIRY